MDGVDCCRRDEILSGSADPVSAWRQSRHPERRESISSTLLLFSPAEAGNAEGVLYSLWWGTIGQTVARG